MKGERLFEAIEDIDDKYIAEAGQLRKTKKKSLNECRSNYRTIGACEEKFLQRVRKPLPEEMKDGK